MCDNPARNRLIVVGSRSFSMSSATYHLGNPSRRFHASLCLVAESPLDWLKCRPRMPIGRPLLNIRLNKILRLTYRRNFPNNTVKIWIHVIVGDKLFASSDLWGIDGEGVGAQKDRKTKIR
jgi:hypothetical protein